MARLLRHSDTPSTSSRVVQKQQTAQHWNRNCGEAWEKRRIFESTYYIIKSILKQTSVQVRFVKMSESSTATSDSQRPITYFDISIAGQPAGRVVFQLYNDLVPKTAENFRPSCLLFHPTRVPRLSLIPSLCRSTLHRRKGRWKVRKTTMVQRQWLSSRYQKVAPIFAASI